MNISVMWWKKHFNKEPVITKEHNEDFKNSTKCWIFHSDYIDDEIKIRDQKKNMIHILLCKN